MRSPPSPTPETSRLGNGLRLSVIPLPHLHSITLAFYVKTGARFETAADNGLSHFVEHMLFRGSLRHPSSWQLNAAFESLGGTLYAETARDYSLFQLQLVPDVLPEGFKLFAEPFLSSLFSDIERERQLILEELSEDFNEHGQEINGSDLAREQLFGPSHLGQRILGSRENIERFSDADIRRHFSSHFVGANCILAVAGPITLHEAQELALQSGFDQLPQGQEQVLGPLSPHAERPGLFQVSDAGSQTSFTLTIRGPAESDPDFLPLTLLLRTLDDGMSTRLHYELCDQRGLAYSVSAGIDPLFDTSLIEIAGATSHTKVLELSRCLFDLVAAYKTTPVTAEELDKAKRRYRYDILTSIDDPTAMTSWFGGGALYRSDLSLTSRVEKIRSVTAEDLLRVARRLFVPEKLAYVTVGHSTKKSTKQLQDALQVFAQS